jgi:3D (Asp-Asp-Asp) domain-containing protein
LATAACGCVLACLAAGSASGTGPASRVATLSADAAAVATKQRAAILDLYSLDERLATAEGHLAGLQAEAATLRSERATLGHALRLARTDARLSQSRLALRLRFIYEHGNTSSLDFVMGARSLGDAITALDDFNRVAASNASVLLQVRSAQHHLSVLTRTLAARERTLAQTTASARATVDELGRLKTERVAYLASLANRRTYDAQQIAMLNAEAEAAVAKSAALAATPTAATVPSSSSSSAPAPGAQSSVIPVAPSGVVVGGQSFAVSATAYSLPGHTASGLPVGWGIAAVDPSVIPFGTHFYVPGYGEAVAADAGTAIIGARIDLWFPTLAQADAWGRRMVTISIQ